MKVIDFINKENYEEKTFQSKIKSLQTFDDDSSKTSTQMSKVHYDKEDQKLTEYKILIDHNIQFGGNIK